VRQPDFKFLDENITVRPPELAMATSLIDSMAADFDPELYTDDYREALQQVIDAKVGGHEVVAPVEVETKPTAAVDLMAALKASVDRAKAARAGGPAEERPARSTEPTPITSAKSAKKAAEKAASSAASGTPARKTAAKKAPAAKAAPSKAAKS